MKRLKPHPHVIKLLGCVTETGGLVLYCIVLLRECPEHGQEGLVIRVRVDETTEAASTRHQTVGVCDRDRWVGTVLYCLTKRMPGTRTGRTCYPI